MREWGFWDWGGFTVLWVAVALSALDQALKLMPELARHIEPIGDRAKIWFRSFSHFPLLYF
jgi:hypothetical protein